MNKEIKIINYVFKYKEKLNLISIEEYYNYQSETAKIKLLIEDQFYEKNVKITNHTKDKLIFDDLIITKNNIELYIDKYHIIIDINNAELLQEFEKENKGKNNYILFEQNIFTGMINEEEVGGKIFVDFESLVNVGDDYYKIYSIDFVEFSGCFNMISHDYKVSNILLKYKDTEFKNKKIANMRNVALFKLSTYKFIISGNYYWKVNLKVNKTFKSNPATIPFKYQKGNLYLLMKKNLFKTNLKAIGKEMLLISYKYI